MTEIEEAAFINEADKALKSLLTDLEPRADREGFDVEETGEGVTVDFADGRQLLVTRHLATKQLWVSSPLSGASHYRFGNGSWQNTRGGDNLVATVMADIAALAKTS